MKNIIIAGSLIFLYTTNTNAQSESVAGKDEKTIKHELKKEEKRTERTENYQTWQAFLRDFPEAQNVNWNKPSLFDEATFDIKGVTMTAYYDLDNELVGTTNEKAFTDIPSNAQQHIKKHYNGFTIEKVILFDDNEDNDTDMALYGTVFDDADNYFVSLKNDKESIVLKVDMDGNTSFFKKL